ncbi:hypothetical protein Pfo_011982 [Paulownia fortunei]|nr:hypothetical protein Pfo_011982 [Paulownia fortunei]
MCFQSSMWCLCASVTHYAVMRNKEFARGGSWKQNTEGGGVEGCGDAIGRRKKEEREGLAHYCLSSIY